MKKLRITLEGRPYEVLVEVLEDDGIDEPRGSAHPPAPAAQTLARPAANEPKLAAVPSPTAGVNGAAATGPRPRTMPSGAGGEVRSQISGTVVSVEVAVGDTVAEGQQLLTIEAMKMNTYVVAPSAGRITEILTAKGKPTSTGDVLLRLG